MSLSFGRFPPFLSSFVLRELPAIGFHKQLGPIFACVLFIPDLLAKSAFDEDLLTFANQFREILGAGSPNLHVDKRCDFTLLLIDRVGLIDAKRNIRHRRSFWRVTYFG